MLHSDNERIQWTSINRINTNVKWLGLAAFLRPPFRAAGSELAGTPSRGKGLPLHPFQLALAPIMQVLMVKYFAQITNVTCFAPDSTDKVQMESVGTGRRSASYNCNLLGTKLWDNWNIGARADLIGGQQLYSLRTVISFFELACRHNHFSTTGIQTHQLTYAFVNTSKI